MVAGRWFGERADGVVEVVVGERTLDGLELLVGQQYLWVYTLAAAEAPGPLADAGVTVRSFQ